MNSEITSKAAQIIIALIPIVGIVIGGTIVFFYILWLHREKKLKIRMGIYKKAEYDFKTFSLLCGILLVGIGSILSCVLALIDGLSYSLLAGLLPLVVGLCFLIFYKVNPDFKQKK